MLGHLRANLWLLVLSLFICCVLYPLAVLGIAKVFFPNEAEGALIDEKGQLVTDPAKAVGSRLIAQPFTADEYFQPRPSAVSFNAAASGASNWGANNYLLRDRVARQLGPIVKYRGGPSKGQPVGPDVESWFQKDRFQGQPGIVSQWAAAHSTPAANWVKADKKNGEYVEAWKKTHPTELAAWLKENPDNTDPKPEDLAVPFFTSYAAAHPGTFPGAVEHKAADGKTEKTIEPVKEGSDIQSIFFDMWLLEYPDVDLEPVPADMVMASGSGLDPDITLKNALYQLDRVAGAWAKKNKSDEAKTRKEIERVLSEKAAAPLAGLAGVELVNVLEVNLAVRNQLGSKEVLERLAPPPAATPAEAKPPAAAAPAPAEEIMSIRTQIGEIASQIGKLGTQIAAIARRDDDAGKTREGIKAIEDRITKLASDTRDIPGLSDRLNGLEGRVKSADDSVRQLGTKVQQAVDALKALPKPAPPAAAPSSRRDQTLDAGAVVKVRTAVDLAPGVALFTKGQYASAAETFRALTRDYPDDARVWYYTALAQGIATNQWGGETEALVNKGVEREKAGTPAPAQIDTAFSSLAPASVREWLAAYRQRAALRPAEAVSNGP
jgi:K+-transporting ATPase ATPase C chain